MKRKFGEIINSIKETIHNYEKDIFHISDIQRDCKVAYETAKRHLTSLEELGEVKKDSNNTYKRL